MFSLRKLIQHTRTNLRWLVPYNFAFIFIANVIVLFNSDQFTAFGFSNIELAWWTTAIIGAALFGLQLIQAIWLIAFLTATHAAISAMAHFAATQISSIIPRRRSKITATISRSKPSHRSTSPKYTIIRRASPSKTPYRLFSLTTAINC